MKTRLVLVAVMTLCAPWAVPQGAAEQGPTAKSRPVLDKGMTTEAVIAAIGRPQEVKPLESPEGSAEMWTYRRLVKKSILQTATKVQSVPAFIGVGADGPSMIQSRLDPIYSLEHVAHYQVTSLLFFNGQLVTARQWVEQRREFE